MDHVGIVVDEFPKHVWAMLKSGPHARVDEDLDASESLDRCDDELVVVVDEDWTHRVVNLCALSPTVGANVDALDQR